MANYRATFGKKIKFLTSDLSMSTATEGEIFYNSTAKDFKVGVSLTAWSSGPTMNKARASIMGASAAPATAAIGFGGYAPPIGPNASGGRAQTEEYDGSSWTEVGDLNTKKFSGAGFGTQTAAIKTGGVDGPYPATRSVNRTESWDGSSWTEVGDVNTIRTDAYHHFGSVTAGLIAGGQNPPNSPSTLTNNETWDGSSWTTSPVSLGVARERHGGSGSTTAAIVFAGKTPSASQADTTEELGDTVTLKTITDS